MANTIENANLCGLDRKDFQATVNGKKQIYTSCATARVMKLLSRIMAVLFAPSWFLTRMEM